MVLVSCSILVVGRAPPNGCHQHLCLQGESHLPPASLGSSLRSVSGSDSGSFQLTASTLGLRADKIFHMPFKSGVFFPQPSGSPVHKPHWPSKPDILGVPFPSGGPLGPGNPMCGSSPLLFGENL